MIFARIAVLWLGASVVSAEDSVPPEGTTTEGWSKLIETAFPTWCINADEERLTNVDKCTDGTPNGRWSPLYFTKRHSGEDPALGGYPTNFDTRYPFEGGSGFFGQAGAGSPHHCAEDFDGSLISSKKCPKIVTDSDDGFYGAGHVPPHISLAAVTKAFNEEKNYPVADWFNFETNACRIMPHQLLKMIRMYFPRDAATGKAAYPAPFSVAGGPGGETGYYPLEFVNLVGDSCQAEKEKHPEWGNLECYETHSGGGEGDYPSYLLPGHGSPHYCTKEGKAADVNDGWCPYLFFGPNRGKYRHPHIAFAALEVYIAHLTMPEQCGATWDEGDGVNYPSNYDVAFPRMAEVEDPADENGDPDQPKINKCGWIWPGPEGTKRKPVAGVFDTKLYLTPTTEVPDPDKVACNKAKSKSSKRGDKAGKRV